VQIVSLPPTLFKIHSFCLMPNHFHILIEQCGDIPVSKLMLKVSTSFAMYINKKYKRVGNIFQDCFKSVSIDNNTQLMWVISYIHMNPVKDGIVANPYDYKWSSYNDFTGEKNLPIVSQDLVPELFGSKENFIRQNFTLSKKDLLRATLSSF
ncbi:MAG: transposase, partial [Patescibacteria group bacterium]